MPKACRAYVSGQNSAGHVKVCPVAAICLNRDRAKVSTRALAVFGALAHHLDHAPDAVILRPGTRLHLLQSFFRGMPLDDIPPSIHWAAWWSKSIVRARPRQSALWQCLSGHFDGFLELYEERYQPRYGFLRPIIPEVVNKFLDCGDLERGFARVRCDHCKHEYLLALSCKGRWFCPSCHQKKVQLFGALLTETILFPVPHRHFTFGIPKMLRPYVRFDRDLLKDLCRLAQYIIRNPFAVEKMQVSPPNQANPDGLIIYRSELNPKIQRNFEVFTPCDFIAAITQHIPDKSFQLVRYYGWYSNKMRGQRDQRAAEEAAAAGQVVQIIDVSEHKPRRIPSAKWRELIKKVWEADPLLCHPVHCGRSDIRISGVAHRLTAMLVGQHVDDVGSLHLPLSSEKRALSGSAGSVPCHFLIDPIRSLTTFGRSAARSADSSRSASIW